MGALHHDASVVDGPEKWSNMIRFDTVSLNTNPGGSFALPQTQASQALNQTAVKQYLANTRQLIKEWARASSPIATLVPLSSFLTVQHLELCQLKLFLPLNSKGRGQFAVGKKRNWPHTFATSSHYVGITNLH